MKMKNRYSLAALCLATLFFSTATIAGDNPIVVMKTSHGDITLVLYPKKSPETVANFLAYVDSDFYDGTIFHRVVKRFVIQGGGFTSQLVKKPTRDPIKNESSNRLYNDRGTIAMARLPDPDSASSQFFINLNNNGNLNYRMNQPGYTVFGEVIDGMQVVKAIGKTKTQPKGQHTHLPIEPIVIHDIVRQSSEKKS